jgi:Probable Zinc-ribbon domain
MTKKKQLGEEISVEKCGINKPKKGDKCKYGGNRKKPCKNGNCEICFWKSFACMERSKYWSKKNIFTPRQITKNCHKKFLFDCVKCGHEFDIDPHKITQSNNWCQFCSNQKLCDNEYCKTCWEKSFASSSKAKYWSEKNWKNPRQVFKTSATHKR